MVLKACSFLWSLRSLRPFSKPKSDDLKVLNELVLKLPVPEHTKHSIFAMREPESQSVIYMLAMQNLSGIPAWNAMCLIRREKGNHQTAVIDVTSSISCGAQIIKIKK